MQIGLRQKTLAQVFHYIDILVAYAMHICPASGGITN
jgi:hypothetical protein